MAWNKKKRNDGGDELFSENSRIERERKQGAIEDAQAMADNSGTPEEGSRCRRTPGAPCAASGAPPAESAGASAWWLPPLSSTRASMSPPPRTART